MYTDGACSNNGKPGARAGLGVYFGLNHKKNVSERLIGQQTNNRAELTAAIRAIEVAPNHFNLLIFTDSEYVRKGGSHQYYLSECDDYHRPRTMDVWLEETWMEKSRRESGAESRFMEKDR